MKIALTVLALALALPTIGSSEEGRYQAVQMTDGIVMIIDTRSGWANYICTVEYGEDDLPKAVCKNQNN